MGWFTEKYALPDIPLPPLLLFFFIVFRVFCFSLWFYRAWCSGWLVVPGSSHYQFFFFASAAAALLFSFAFSGFLVEAGM
ncbi:predicted protein [Plenodomus lingam JN3]|uniref:Predicted protein n=1 Tax=Leptosphaeria maculans (strain JN3 / isolate v23.1.3 / race Av1-4-5-6-7-8) TaxID=985895 RepID=E4ZLS6_LEPMJ|nr:predicted protein [Plenodomus lingam JN3]CBX92756.1 predicted protein [Plenodomus lingam JN3]